VTTTAGTCSALSLAAGEPLAGTAARADAFLLVEVRGGWQREALDGLEGDGAAAVRAWLEATPRSKVLLVRRPGRRTAELAAFVVHAATDPPTIRRFGFGGHDDLLAADLGRGGEPVAGPIVLVCGHGRRDACCARLGRPLYDALREELEPDSLWLSSHQGGHRFAPNLLWLPEGLAFGRVEPESAAALVDELRHGRLPLDRFRGRTTLPPEAQAAEIAARAGAGAVGVGDVELVSAEGGRVRLALPAGEVDVVVEVRPGRVQPQSCGAPAERLDRLVVTSIMP